MSAIALETLLNPFIQLFKEDNLNEIMINKPGELWIEKNGVFETRQVDFINIDYLVSLSNVVAQYTSQFISSEKPLLSASLSNGLRIQIVFKPICGVNNIAMTIRNNYKKPLSLQALHNIGIFKYVNTANKSKKIIEALYMLLNEKRYQEFISFAVKYKKNIIISGGASSGKTTFLNACLNDIDPAERIITIEDVNEISLLNHPNKLHLISSSGGQGVSKVTIMDLIDASLRLRPDRIILGELRGTETFSFLRSINSGHPGALSTMHADSPQMAIEQLKLMVMQSDLGMTMSDIHEYVLTVIDVIIQCKKAKNGIRYIESIWMNDQKFNVNN